MADTHLLYELGAKIQQLAARTMQIASMSADSTSTLSSYAYVKALTDNCSMLYLLELYRCSIKHFLPFQVECNHVTGPRLSRVRYGQKHFIFYLNP